MSVVLDFSDDTDIWDNTITVRLTSSRTRGSMVETVKGALGRQLSKVEKATSAGAYEGAGLTWLLPAKHVENGPLKAGDVVEAEEGNHLGAVFTAQSADLACEGAFWRLVCLDLSIVHDLRDEVTIERPDVGYDASGAAVMRFPPDGGREVYRNLAAKVQLVDKTLVEERLVSGFKGTHTVTVAKQIELGDKDRVRFVKDGTTYYLDVLGLRNPESITELPVIDGELKP